MGIAFAEMVIGGMFGVVVCQPGVETNYAFLPWCQACVGLCVPVSVCGFCGGDQRWRRREYD